MKIKDKVLDALDWLVLDHTWAWFALCAIIVAITIICHRACQSAERDACERACRAIEMPVAVVLSHAAGPDDSRCLCTTGVLVSGGGE